MAKAFFDEKKIPFEEKDVALDDKAREEMLNKSHQMGVPVIDIDGQIVIGFNKEYLGQLIGVKWNLI